MEENRKNFEDKIRVQDLKCGQGIPKEEFKKRRLSSDRAFDLGKLPTKGLREEFRSFLLHRGEILSLSSIRGEFWPYNLLCQFLQEAYADLESLLMENLETMERALKVWLVKNGYPLSYQHYKKAFGKKMRCQTNALSYLSKIYQFLQPQSQEEETQRDVWRLEKLSFSVKQNPSRPWLTLNFQGILQEEMRQEVKKACAVALRYAAVSSVGGQIQAAKRFSSFMLQAFPHRSSFLQIGRKELEDYLVYLRTEELGKKSFRTELFRLKSLLYTIGQIYESKTLQGLFLWGDIPREREQPPFRIYSEAELQRLNEGILTLDEQVARALALHQLLGNRISETLTLKQDCLVKRGGYMQPKRSATSLPARKSSSCLGSPLLTRMKGLGSVLTYLCRNPTRTNPCIMKKCNISSWPCSGRKICATTRASFSAWRPTGSATTMEKRLRKCMWRMLQLPSF